MTHRDGSPDNHSEETGPPRPQYQGQGWPPPDDEISLFDIWDSLVRFGAWPARAPDSLVEDLRLRVDTDGIVMVEQPEEPTPGQKIRVTEGPLTGVEGIVTAKNGRDRVDLLLAIVGRSTRAQLSTSQIAGVRE